MAAAWHLYAVVDEASALSLRGLPSGVRGTPVQWVASAGLAAAASPLEGGGRQAPSVEDLRDHASVTLWLTQQAEAVVPFRFGMRAPSVQAVRRLLERNEAPLRDQLQRLRGTVEAALVGFWEKSALQAAVLRHASARRAYAAIRRSGGAGWGAEPHPEAAVELGALTERVVETWREHYAAEAERRLQAVVLAVHRHRVLGIRMLFNLALWVPRQAQVGVGETVHTLQRAWQGRVRLRLTMPLPPFSFTDVVLEVPEA